MKPRWSLTLLILVLVAVSLPMALWHRAASARRRVDERGTTLLRRLQATPPDVWVQTIKSNIELKGWIVELLTRFMGLWWGESIPEHQSEWEALASLQMKEVSADPLKLLEPRLTEFAGKVRGDPNWRSNLSKERQQEWFDAFERIHLSVADPQILPALAASNPDVAGMSVLIEDGTTYYPSLDTFRSPDVLQFNTREGFEPIGGGVMAASGRIGRSRVRMYKLDVPAPDGARLWFVVILDEP